MQYNYTKLVQLGHKVKNNETKTSSYCYTIVIPNNEKLTLGLIYNVVLLPLNFI